MSHTPPTTANQTNRFTTDAREIVKDLSYHNPFIYWFDFLVSLSIGYGFAAAYLNATLFSAEQLVCLLVASFALYRVASFMHEIVHFRSGEMKWFRLVWNVIAGIPMLTPTFFYQSHNDHHNARHYGTEHDGEYLPLGTGNVSEIALFLLQILLQPIFVTLRFLLAPFSFLHPRLRQWTLEHASSFVIDFRYRRKIPRNAPLMSWAAMDLLCSLRAWAIFAFILAGVTDWTRIPQLYALATLALGWNHIRTLSAHRYLTEGHRVSHAVQVIDSTNITGVPILTELLFPLGMRYHALHHLFPYLPYHNLGIAHRRLMNQLPANSPYRATVYPSWFAVISELVRSPEGEVGMLMSEGVKE
ncbi:Fatty acid desaturase [Roseimaritima multifibrata]|uniref:Fatty acid desaturase n=1 Tax=Roseimaritima multifibrata TaxID=1930274 RepID=A0A517MGZ3_9BACT|nr:fatty acid desaturase [Roseimaritima multifibrata]QDS94152.1 Fatty acid desaturase [Roseimaritima multifibrata]